MCQQLKEFNRLSEVMDKHIITKHYFAYADNNCIITSKNVQPKSKCLMFCAVLGNVSHFNVSIWFLLKTFAGIKTLQSHSVTKTNKTTVVKRGFVQQIII